MSTKKNPTSGLTLEVFGPTVEFLTLPEEEHNDFCVMKGEIPPGVAVPLHSHSDTEDFIVISGEIEALRQDKQGYEWISAQAGDYIHIPGNSHHAWRNVSNKPAVLYITVTNTMAQFFKEIGRPVKNSPQPVTPEDLAHFEAVSAKYNYWNASPEENAAVGITFSF
ncbi:cupin domain-containing protein [Gracilibacillus sp. HCP3S3_G5_1]|uniref:cupin domain-containing protein n=1 Tax=unclassified Gracilibacillus TaxID=2625209 RepID=UPI003F8889E8